MNICFVYYSIFSLGGIQRCITELSNYLVKKGYNVSIICTNKKTHVNRKIYELDEKVDVRILKNDPLWKKIIRKIILKINNMSGILNNEKILNWIYSIYNKEIEDIVRKENFDVVIGCGAYHIASVSLLKNVSCKKIGWQHSNYEGYFDTKNANFYNQDKIIKEIFEKLDKYIVLTDVDKEKLKVDEKNKIIRIYNPVGIHQEQKSELKSKRFLALGRLSKEKGFDILINNFYEFNKKNSEWTLDIYGDGPEREKLEKQVNDLKLGNYVRIMHRTNDVKEIYRDASIYCMTSFIEGLPMVILEAMESGLPIIAYTLPCIEEILANNSEGKIIEGRNDRKYIETMLELAENKQEREEIARNAINRVKEFSIENIGKQWEDFLYNITNNKKE